MGNENATEPGPQKNKLLSTHPFHNRTTQRVIHPEPSIGIFRELNYKPKIQNKMDHMIVNQKPLQ